MSEYERLTSLWLLLNPICLDTSKSEPRLIPAINEELNYLHRLNKSQCSSIGGMEHLPPVTSPYEPVLVPYIADAVYDALDFAGYPARRGFNIDNILRGDFGGRTKDEVAAFLQTWLCFGLVHEITKCSSNDFPAFWVREDESGRKWITTEKLAHLLRAMKGVVEQEKLSSGYTNERARLRNQRIQNALRLSMDTWESFQKMGDSNPMPPEVALGIQILAITLNDAATELFGTVVEDTFKTASWERDSRYWRVTRNEWLERRMMGQKWCPVLIDQLQKKYGVQGLYYCSLLGSPGRELDHKLCRKYEEDCEAMKTFETQHGTHVVDGCNCEYLSVDRSQLGDIIGRDEIPVLHLRERDGKAVLDVVSSASTDGFEYTAISHVWSDGWGNPLQNSLRLCRVRKIVEWVSRSYDIQDLHIGPRQGPIYRETKHDNSVFFWMDTLCVPRQPIETYNKAIGQMREVYARAERVLVLDSSLLSCTSKAKYAELNMRILCSRWIRRLWTVQEAVLPRRLIFQFKDGPYMNQDGSIAMYTRNKDLKVNYFNTIGYFASLPFDNYKILTGIQRTRNIWMGLLKNRAVSVKTDEPVCGAILMDFDMKTLLAFEKKDRMREFWRMHEDGVPLDILYVPGERLRDPAFSWALASILAVQRVGWSKQIGTVTVDGLRARINAYRSFRLITTPAEMKESIFPILLDGYKYFVKKSPVISEPSWEGLDLHKRKMPESFLGPGTLVIFIEMSAVQREDGRWVVQGGASRVALVEVVGLGKKEDGVFCGKYLRAVSLIQEGSSNHRFPFPPWTEGEIEEGNRKPCEAEWIGEEVEWCLG